VKTERNYVEKNLRSLYRT